MTRLKFLGSGSAFTVGADNFHSNMLLINEQNQKLLLDCGSDIRFSLYEAGLSYEDITDIYISHLHADHAGGLEYIGFSTKFNPACNKPNLYLSPDLAEELWDHTLSGGMKYIEGDIASLETFFHVRKLDCNNSFIWDDIAFKLVKVVHVQNRYSIMPSYGLFFRINHQNIFLTTDAQLRLEYLEEFYEKADIIFQDCEISHIPSKIHAHYQELLKLPKKIRNKMWLYHYQPGILPQAKKDGFCGFVKPGQIFDFSKSYVSTYY
jgi:ribonuclease BN (tRNA processing enzyme)